MWLKRALLLLFLSSVQAKIGESSLTFVIDDTSSMKDDIDQVRRNTNLVFDTVLNSNESQIDNFILVTFNDPSYKVLTITKDRATFKNALASIHVHGGGDCPEEAMGGIEKALEVSHPSSYIYVFTDATAKDCEKLERIQNTAVNKQSQIVFLLTGHCEQPKTAPGYAAYYSLSKATNGKVFHMDKSNVGQVLKYVSDSIESKRTTFVDTELSPGHHDITFKVDSTVKDTTIVLAGEKDKKLGVEVYKPNGTKAETDIIVDIPRTKIVKVYTPELGNYSARVDTESESTLSITGKSEFHFRHGFTTIPSTINATTTQPLAGKYSYILVQLETPDENIKLKSIDIVDLEDNIIEKFKSKILDERSKTYYAEKFFPPTRQFKIAINAQNNKTGETIKRYSMPIASQKPKLTKETPRPPTVEIVEGTEVIASYNEPLRLTCKVNGYPEPTIFWKDFQGGVKLDRVTPEPFEPPYSYIAVKSLPPVTTNQRYRCIAVIDGVTATKDVNVVLKNFFEMVEIPKDVYHIPYNEDAIIPCKVNAHPPATTTWYFNGKILTGGENVKVSDDRLTIKHMQPNLEGKYSCSVQNDFEKNDTDFKVYLTGFERPVIDKRTSTVSVLQGSDVALTCRLLSGKPTPQMRWTQLRENLDGDIELHDSNTSIVIRNVKKEFSGTYKCKAWNAAGLDRHFISLNVEFPPTIKRGKNSINARGGTSQILHCQATGNPKPHVIWTFNGRIVVPDRDHQIYRDHSLKIKASMANSGKYTCGASNKHGTATQAIDVYFVEPVSIRIPEISTINTRVKKDVKLECIASGYPEPTIQWTFRTSDPAGTPKIFRPDSSGSLSLKNLQLNSDGFYTCNASNIGGATNITYQVNVHGPPEIVNVDKSTIYRAVEGDVVLRIPCKALGRPKPAITWSFQGFNIAKGTEWYDIEDDGTLLIKNVDLKSRGYHLCKATNYLGSDQKYFLVDVSRSPYENTPTSFVAVQKDERAVVNCALPQEIGSKLRWFKNGVLISEGPLVIEKVAAEDSGVYTCRVSTFTGSKSASIEVIVASTPEFQTEPETKLDFEEDSYIELDCTNYAEPPAKTEWFFNGKKIDTDSDFHYFEMHLENIGQYRCVVSNEIGSINRTFVIKPTGCAMHIQDDFSGNLPLMVVPYYLSIKTTGDYFYVPKNQILKLSCPTEFISIKKPEITATCKEDTDFYVDGNVYKFSDLKCSSKRTPKVIRKGFRCGHVNTESVDVGFMTGGRFSPVYEVCVDKKNSMPIFTKLSLRRALAGVEPKDSKWFNSVYVPFDFESMYQCDRQNVEISRTLNKYFHDRDACCFGRRQLVSPKDVMPGLSQVATYSNLNVVPQWSTCHAENWNDMEDRLRVIAKTTTDTLLVWTGQARQLTLPDSSHYDVNVTITDGSRQQAVPKYLWKVVQDPASRSSIAIVQVNIPDLKPEDAGKHVLCSDVCDSVRWMNGGTWRDVTKGYTYCCRIREFEDAFGYRNKFSNGGDNLLTEVTYISTHALS